MAVQRCCRGGVCPPAADTAVKEVGDGEGLSQGAAHAPRLCGRDGAVASVAGEGAAWRPSKEGARMLAC